MDEHLMETPATDVVAFWHEAGPERWFAKDPAFDAAFRARFLALHEHAAAGALESWSAAPDSALALVLLLDQFPRNAFRGTPRMYATDAQARACAAATLQRGFDARIAPELRVFLVLPFAHSESLADQDRSVALAAGLGPHHRERAEHHRDIVRRFGRFPHRNPILGREMTAQEQRYLDDGGYLG